MIKQKRKFHRTTLAQRKKRHPSAQNAKKRKGCHLNTSDSFLLSCAAVAAILTVIVGSNVWVGQQVTAAESVKEATHSQPVILHGAQGEAVRAFEEARRSLKKAKKEKATEVASLPAPKVTDYTPSEQAALDEIASFRQAKAEAEETGDWARTLQLAQQVNPQAFKSKKRGGK